MKTRHSTAWVASKQPRKQRKYRYNAPLHIKGTFMTVHLAKNLRDKYGIRSLRVRTGDKVRVMRGQYAKQEGKVESIDLRATKVFVQKVSFLKKDGATRVAYPLSPSNLMIVEFDTTDKRRAEKLKVLSEKTKSGKDAKEKKQ